MKRLSDYHGNEAIELWADLIDPLTAILTDEEIRKIVQSGSNKIEIAKQILKKHSAEATDILLRIDDSPIDGLNIVLRLVNLLAEIGENEEIKIFFGFAEQDQTGSASIGSVTESTEGEEN